MSINKDSNVNPCYHLSVQGSETQCDAAWRQEECPCRRHPPKKYIIGAECLVNVKERYVNLI